MPRIAFISTGRADLGLLEPILDACAETNGVDPRLYATGALVNADGSPATARPVAATIPILTNAATMGDAIAKGVAGFTSELSNGQPDAVLLLGDRFETLAAAVAAAALGLPIVHLHGGELSAGAADNQFRYAITALAHLHLVATDRARERLIAMGEPEKRVIRVGAPGLDRLASFEPMPRDAFVAEVGLPTSDPFLLVTLHPTTLDPTPPAEHARILLAALDAAGLPCLVTTANQDPGGDAINAVLEPAARDRGWPVHDALGTRLYTNAMHHAAAMVGNSSSGIIEAHTLRLPVVNIGDRQQGRERNASVIDARFDVEAVASAIQRATQLQRSAAVFSDPNIYGDGRTAARVARILADTPLDLALVRKPFEPPALAHD